MLCGAMLCFDATNAHLTGIKAAIVRRDRAPAQLSTAQHSTAQHSTAQRSAAQRSAAQHSSLFRLWTDLVAPVRPAKVAGV